MVRLEQIQHLIDRSVSVYTFRGNMFVGVLTKIESKESGDVLYIYLSKSMKLAEVDADDRWKFKQLGEIRLKGESIGMIKTHGKDVDDEEWIKEFLD